MISLSTIIVRKTSQTRVSCLQLYALKLFDKYIYILFYFSQENLLDSDSPPETTGLLSGGVLANAAPNNNALDGAAHTGSPSSTGVHIVSGVSSGSASVSTTLAASGAASSMSGVFTPSTVNSPSPPKAIFNVNSSADTPKDEGKVIIEKKTVRKVTTMTTTTISSTTKAKKKKKKTETKQNYVVIDSNDTNDSNDTSDNNEQKWKQKRHYVNDS